MTGRGGEVAAGSGGRTADATASSLGAVPWRDMLPARRQGQYRVDRDNGDWRRAPTNEVQSVPTLHKEAGYVFEMVMFDCQERRHAHVRGNGKSGAKFWLEPAVEMASPGRYNENELKQISRIIRENLATMTQRWDDECARVQAEGTAR